MNSLNRKIRLFLLTIVALFSLVVLSLAQNSGVFIHNRQMDLDTGDNTVSVIHFIRLLEPEEQKRVLMKGMELLLTDSSGVEHRLPLDAARRLSQWPTALELLGYSRRQNQDTGIVDYSLPNSVESLSAAGKIEEIDSRTVRLERSNRRPGYRKARINYDKIIAKIKLSDDQYLRDRVNRIGQMIAAKSPLAGLAWNFDVIDTQVPNALCTGEGHVLVTTGLLDLELTDDELAGVLGHEVAHGVRRHAEIYEERFKEYLSVRRAYFELQSQLRRSESDRDKGRIQTLRSQLDRKEKRFNYVLNYLKNKKDYDQDEEEEADVLGVQYAVAAGFDAEGEARALVKLQKRSVQLFGQSYNEGSRTHPPLERRLKILEIVRRRWREDRHNR